MKRSRSWKAAVLAAGAAMAQASCQSLERPADLPVDPVSSRLTSGALPGDVPITVGIDAPAGGALLGAGPLAVSGTASVDGAPPLSTDLVYVLDTSGSTINSGCGGQQNDDVFVNTILDCELLAARTINAQVVAGGAVAHVALVLFDDSHRIRDVSQAAGLQRLAAPDADDDGDGQSDFGEAIQSVTFGHDFTSFGAGVIGSGVVLGESSADRKLVLFMSDGKSNFAPAVADAVATLPPGTVVNTLAIGAEADGNCDTPSPWGNLRDIATLTGGVCVDVPAFEDLPTVAPTLVVSQLTSITLRVDGNPTPITTVSQPLPRTGPASVTWNTTVTGLSPGQHQLCATAIGTNAGAEGSVEECVTVHINQPPVALCQNLSLTAGAACNATGLIDGGSFDPDGNLTSCTQSPPGPYGLGLTAVTLTCADAFGASSSCTSTISVADVTPPVVSSAPPVALWPPNHQYAAAALDQCIASAVDACDGSLPVSAGHIVRVTSDEPEDSKGSGRTCQDILPVDATHVNLRAEREGTGDGRVYTIHFTVSDGSGNATPGTCRVMVPHDQGGGVTDSQPAFCVGDGCGSIPGPDPACGH